MIDFDAADHLDASAGSTLHPRIGGRRMTDLSAMIGGTIWLVLVGATVAGTIALTVVELFVCFALLTLVPLGLGLAATPRRSNELPFPYTIAVVWQFPAALAAIGALSLPVGSLGSITLILPWLGVTGAIAMFGLWRLLSRGLTLRPLPELAIDAALFYIPVGAVALLLHRAGISLYFEPIIILLTVVHYHYAGFVLPLVAGLAGRVITDDTGRFGADITGRVAAATTLVIIVNLALIAIGITFSPLVEVVAVVFFTIAVAGFSVLILCRVVPGVSRVPGVLLTVATLSIIVTMALALGYGYSQFMPTKLITIGEMIRWHGSLNAFGFALPAMLTFRLMKA